MNRMYFPVPRLAVLLSSFLVVFSPGAGMAFKGGGNEAVISEICGECVGQVTYLELQYHGPAGDLVRITNKQGSTRTQDVLWEGIVPSDGVIGVEGQSRHGQLGANIYIYVNGAFNAAFHTSCSQPIGPGLVRGDFLVIEARSRDGGLLCPVDEGCPPCESGATRLTLRHDGDEAAEIVVTQQRGGSRPELFRGVVEPGGTFSFSGVMPHGLMVPRIFVWKGQEQVIIHTSCEDPPEPGRIYGDFTVTSGFHNAGPFCPADDPECPPGLAGPRLELDVRLEDSEFMHSGTKMPYQRSIWEGRVTSDADLVSFEIFDLLNAEASVQPPFATGTREVTFEVEHLDPRGRPEGLVNWSIQAEDKCGNLLVQCPDPNLPAPSIEMTVHDAEEFPYRHVVTTVTAPAGIVMFGYYNTRNAVILGEPVFEPGDTFIQFLTTKIDHDKGAYLGAVVQDACGKFAEEDPPFRWGTQGIERTAGVEHPHDYRLAQNYPNPFNPRTRIEFQLPEDQTVTLRIFDVLGREVKTLVDGEMRTGYHTVMWDGTDAGGMDVAGGVYLYRLQAGPFSATRSLTLIK